MISRAWLLCLAICAGCSAPVRAPGHAETTKACQTECVAVLDAMFTWTAQEFGVPWQEVLVDTARSGFEMSTRPFAERQKPVRPNQIAAARERHGFAILRTDQTPVLCTGDECTIARGKLILTFFAPDISGATARMTVRVVRETTTKGGLRVDRSTLGQARILSQIYEIRFRRVGGAWTVSSAEVVATS